MRLSHYHVVGIFGVTGREGSPHTRGLVVFLVSQCKRPRRKPSARPWAMGSRGGRRAGGWSLEVARCQSYPIQLTTYNFLHYEQVHGYEDGVTGR